MKVIGNETTKRNYTMKFKSASTLNERNYKLNSVNPTTTLRKHKAQLLRACGVEAKMEGGKLLVKKPNGEIIDIWDDPSVIEFYYKNDEAMEKWKKFYHTIKPGNKDRKVSGKTQKRYTPGDFLVLSDLESAMPLDMPYYQFLKDLSDDVIVHWVK